MSVQVEKLENNMAKLSIEVSAEEFDAAVKKAYESNKSRFNVPGFRRGKAPFAIIKKMYGVGVFYEEAVNSLIDSSYPEAVKECGEKVVSSPSINVTQFGEGQPLLYEATVALEPPVELGEYKGVEVEKAVVEVTEEDIDKALETERDKNARIVDVTDRPVKAGDQITLDFKGYVDGKSFEGGEAQDYPLTIGSNTFIPGFEDQLVGKSIGVESEVNVPFPDDYPAKELKGKDARFVVTVKTIKEKQLPELNDEFASEVSDFETLAEYREDLRAKIQTEKERQATSFNEDRVVEKVVANATIDVPQAMIETEARGMIENFAQQLQGRNGISMDDYMKYTGMTTEKLMEQFTPDAEKRIRTRLTLEKVAEVENIEIDDEAVDAQIEKMAGEYQIEVSKFRGFISDEQRENLRKDLRIQEAIDFLVAEAKLI